MTPHQKILHSAVVVAVADALTPIDFQHYYSDCFVHRIEQWISKVDLIDSFEVVVAVLHRCHYNLEHPYRLLPDHDAPVVVGFGFGVDHAFPRAHLLHRNQHYRYYRSHSCDHARTSRRPWIPLS